MDVFMTYYESEFLEFKEIVTLNLKKEIIAFANSQGGEIIIGMNDAGEITGVNDPDFEMQRIGSMIRDGIHPDITPFTSIKQEIMEDKSIIKITVQSGTKKPYHLSEKGLKPSGVFIRHGVSSVPATETRIREMITDTDGIEYDKIRCLNQDLTFSQSESYFKESHL